MDNPAPSSRRRLLIGVIGFGLLALAVWQLPVLQWLHAAESFAASHPVRAAAAYVAMFVAGTVLMTPGSLLLMIGGFVFGLPLGALLGSIGVLFGATASFLIARGIGWPLVAQVMDSNKTLAALDSALAKRGFFVVVLTRLAMVLPFNLLNYAYGLTRIRPGLYATASWLGMLPATVLYAYLGSAATDMDELLDGNVDSPYTAIAILVAIIGVTVVVHRAARAQLQRQIDAPESDGGG